MKRSRHIDSAAARRWIDDSLSAGGSLSHLVRAAYDLDGGAIDAILPPGEDADRPDVGFGTREASTALLFNHLHEAYEPHEQLVVEDELLRRTDHQRATEFGTPVVFRDDEVFHVQVLRALVDARHLEEFLNWSSAGHPLNAFVVGPSELDPASLNEEIDYPALERLANGIRCVIVGAYDSDGFLIWLPGSPSR